MRIFFTLVTLFFYSFGFAQLKGIVTDGEGEPLPGAAAALYQNDKLVTGVTTEPDGRFEISAAQGTYVLKVSFIAFQTYTRTISIGQSSLNLGEIALLESSTALEEVTVEATANLMEFKQDKRIFNVSKDISSIGSNASDILNNVPSVSVGVEGEISLRGSQNVRILIDGKPSGLVGNDPATALRLLQGNMIERIEVITNPSARYDAEGEAGIINIVLKKEERKGINGTFEANVGYPHNYGVTAGINYRTGKFNWFANGSLSYRRSPGGGFSDQHYTLADSSYSLYTDRDQSRGEAGATLRFGADYSLSPSQTLTGTFLYRPSKGTNISELTYDYYDENGDLNRTTFREDNETETELNLEADLHYENQFKGKDHKLTADFKYQNSDDREDSDILQTLEDSNTDFYQYVNNQEDEQTILLQTDYVKPFSEDRRMEFGAKATLRDIINNYSVDQQNASGEIVPVDQFTNNFSYQEYIYAAYGIYSDALGQSITYQLGLRSEYSDITTIQHKENFENNKNYINFFPSAFVTWKINKTSDFQVNYSRRISRPWFRALMPFSNYSDNVNLRVGNPDLNPEYTDSYETGYLRYLKKGSIYGGVYYRHRTNVVQRIRTVVDTGGTISKPVNLAVQDAYGFEFNYMQDITKWYMVSANFNIYNAITVGSYQGVDYGNTNFSASGRLMNRFRFWKSDLQLSFNFQAPENDAQGRRLGMYTADIGWSKDVLKGNGTISLSVRDLFNTRKWRYYTTTEGLNSYSEFQWRQRQITLSFSYRLNQKKSRSSQGRPSDGDFGGDGGM